MANCFSILSFSLLIHFLLHSCEAIISSKTECQVIPRLMAMEPDIYIPSEAGSIEIWNPNTDLFQCAGVRVSRYTVQPNGLLLPFYINSVDLGYVLQGQFILGMINFGCSRELGGEQNECENIDIQRYKKGDLITALAGEVFWTYNDGSEPYIVIVTTRINDVDRLGRFSLAGSQKILDGFSLKFLRESFNIDDDLAMKLQREDLRGNIVYVTDGGLHLSDSPCQIQDQQESKGLSYVNDEEYFCSKRKAKISDPSQADIFISKVGYIKTIDAHQLPVLNLIQLSVTYHLLFEDVIRLPHWENNYIVIYVVKGEGQIQVVDDNGNNVFDGIVKGGQLLVVPKNFVMIELAKSKLLEYIIFKTNANPITSDLSGRNSVISNLPLEVVTNAYNITEKEAKKVKFARKEISLTKIMQKYI